MQERFELVSPKKRHSHVRLAQRKGREMLRPRRCWLWAGRAGGLGRGGSCKGGGKAWAPVGFGLFRWYLILLDDLVVVALVCCLGMVAQGRETRSCCG